MSARGLMATSVCTVALVVLFGCGGDGAGSADRASELYSDGLVDLYDAFNGADLDGAPWEWDTDVHDALSKFEEALRNDPDHCGALLGAAFTRTLAVLTDPRLGEILTELFPARSEGPDRAVFWYAAPPKVTAVARLAVNRRDEFLFSELQEFLETTAIPEFETASAYLTRFEELACEVDLLVALPDSMFDRDQIRVIELDLTDAYFAHAMLDGLQGVCHVLAAYDFDSYDDQTLQELIEDDDDYLTLRPGDHMPLAFSAIASLGQRLIQVADSLVGEGDSQGNDLITESEGLVRLDEMLGGPSAEIVADLGLDIGEALSNGLALQLPEIDPEAPDLSVFVNLDALFNDPLSDLRPYLPAHTWPRPDTMSIDRPVTMPDPTLDGIVPGMADDDWEAVIPWLLQ